MAIIIGVRFRTAGKIYDFNPGTYEVKKGGHVIVETARGIEYGEVVTEPHEVEKPVMPLKEIIRLATDEDVQHAEDNKQKQKEAFFLCKEKIRRHGLEMKLIDCEYTFDNSKILFYFTADGRVDFRELVKDLAGVFRTRIELRQVGVRDETKILGGLGICGRPLCCHSYLNDFIPVSIRMAKEQNLSLNPVKISGVCGRLMCCLKNEEDVYEELNKKLPNIGDYVTTPDGLRGEVQSVGILKQLVKVVVSLPNDEKEIREYPAAELNFRPRKPRDNRSARGTEREKETERTKQRGKNGNRDREPNSDAAATAEKQGKPSPEETADFQMQNAGSDITALAISAESTSLTIVGREKTAAQVVLEAAVKAQNRYKTETLPQKNETERGKKTNGVLQGQAEDTENREERNSRRGNRNYGKEGREKELLSERREGTFQPAQRRSKDTRMPQGTGNALPSERGKDRRERSRRFADRVQGKPQSAAGQQERTYGNDAGVSLPAREEKERTKRETFRNAEAAGKTGQEAKKDRFGRRDFGRREPRPKQRNEAPMKKFQQEGMQAQESQNRNARQAGKEAGKQMNKAPSGGFVPEAERQSSKMPQNRPSGQAAQKQGGVS